jgi:hypothetical protein
VPGVGGTLPIGISQRARRVNRNRKAGLSGLRISSPSPIPQNGQEDLWVRRTAPAYAITHEAARASGNFTTAPRGPGLTDFAVRHVHQGRHVGGAMCVTDVFSQTARIRHGFRVQSITPAIGTEEWQDIAVEDRKIGPAGIATLRVDFQAWLNKFTPRDRQIINHLAAGARTQDVARQFEISEVRVSQKRRTFEQSWTNFQAGLPWWPYRQTDRPKSAG